MFGLPDGSYSVSERKRKEKKKTVSDNPSIRIYVNKIENRITFKIKRGFYLELLTPEAMKLLASIKSKIANDRNGENMLHL